MEKSLEIYMRCKSTEALGPYRRYALWFQGCDKDCKGCISVESRHIEGGIRKSISELVQEIISQTENEGITISGGEPFLQTEGLELLIKSIKQKKDLGIIIYTGYYLAQLNEFAQSDPNINSILSMTDILIDGPYIEELNDGKSLRGSSNQNILFLTNRYKDVADKFYELPNRRVELIINNDNIQLVGIPDSKSCSVFKKALGAKKE